jgi:alcohol dehydrogenase (cytochrome c)
VIPQGKEVGADSWKAGSEKGGGSSWTSYTLEPKNGLLFVSIGNPAPDFIGAARPGDNLFTDSVVVLDYRTGKLAWWVQQVPHDVHDWDTARAPVVYDQDGKAFMAVANKGGWLYLYNRTTHKLLARPEVSDHMNDNAPLTVQGVHHCPGNIGGVSWNGPAYSPRDKLLFVNSVHWCGVSRVSENRYLEGSAYFGGSQTFDPPESAFGWTRAFKAATGAPAWVRKSETPMLAALTPTAGGVIFTGDLSGDFLALDAKTGDTLYRFNTGGSVAGAPSTYLVDGKQYVAITSGNESRFVWKSGGAMTVVVFSLPRS